MNLTLRKPLCFFDLETTGTNIAKDRIVEISILKVFPNGEKQGRTWRVNPGIPIPAEAAEIHGITDDMVASQPPFPDIIPEINEMIADADLAGYNSNRFDIPLLAEEMLRAGSDFDLKNTLTVDVQTIFHKMERRTLEAAYQFYCGKNLDDAHSAEADTNATFEVLQAQVDRYDELRDDVRFLAEFSTQKKAADFANMIVYDKAGNEIFNFGKYKGKSVEKVLENDPGYYGWILNADFPLYTKKVLTGIKLRKLSTTQ